MADEETPKIHIEGDWKSQAQAEKEKLKEEAGESKLHVDSDWKAQARAEKEKLNQQAGGDEQEQGEGQGQMPPADMNALLSGLATQAMFALGLIPDPNSGQRMVHLAMAKHHIDLIGLLEEKTKGNLTEEEEQTLTQTASDLRNAFVQVAQAARQQQAQQAQQGQPGQGGGEAAGGPDLRTPEG